MPLTPAALLLSDETVDAEIAFAVPKISIGLHAFITHLTEEGKNINRKKNVQDKIKKETSLPTQSRHKPHKCCLYS